MLSFSERLKKENSFPLKAFKIEILQVNLGYRCNMSCKHCHLQAGPNREESMDKETAEAVISVLLRNPIKTLDLTGGAPELNPNFKKLVEKAKEGGRHVIVRSNLTILLKKEMNWLPEFLRDHNVEVVASLPYYIEENVDRMRGDGTFKRSIEALHWLNSLGYGIKEDLRLSLVYNPLGAFLPPDQNSLEKEYKRELKDRYGIVFNNLYTFTNMPIGRFKDFLHRSSNYEKYIQKLASSFNPATLDGIMCRYLISVGWNGKLYDCDFNQAIGLGLKEGLPQHLSNFDFLKISEREISVSDHCYGCTAGQGST
jgi:radical SAM/Cys-rich protein